MKNTLPRTVRELVTVAGEMRVGVTQYGGSLPLALVTEAVFTGNITSTVETVLAMGQAKTELGNRHEAVRASLAACRDFATRVRESLKTPLTIHHNAVWGTAGFVGGLSIPKAERDVVALVLAIKGFLANNQAYELEPRNITSAQAQTLLTQLEAARAAVQMQEKLVGDMMLDRDAKAKTLRTSMRSLIRELSVKLTPLDTRWLAFGLNKPGAEATPDVPSNLTVVLLGPTAAALNWGPSARANHYRVWMRLVGSLDWVALGSPPGLDFTIQQMASNSQFEVAVSAVNDGGESAKSEPVTFTTPA